MVAGGGPEALQGLRILVVEDEYFIADELELALADLGAVVVGPLPTVADALELLQSEQAIDLALLDINLRGEKIFPVAEALRARRVPFAFVTGYDGDTLPSAFEDVPRLVKPIGHRALMSTLQGLKPRGPQPSEPTA